MFLAIAKGIGHRTDFGVTLRQAQCGDAQSNEGRREKIEGLRFQYLARVLIALATAILVLSLVSITVQGLSAIQSLVGAKVFVPLPCRL